MFPNKFSEREPAVGIDSYNQMFTARSIHSQICCISSAEAKSGPHNKVDRTDIAVGPMCTLDPFVNGSMQRRRAINVKEMVAQFRR